MGQKVDMEKIKGKTKKRRKTLIGKPWPKAKKKEIVKVGTNLPAYR